MNLYGINLFLIATFYTQYSYLLTAVWTKKNYVSKFNENFTKLICLSRHVPSVYYGYCFYWFIHIHSSGSVTVSIKFSGGYSYSCRIWRWTSTGKHQLHVNIHYLVSWPGHRKLTGFDCHSAVSLGRSTGSSHNWIHSLQKWSTGRASQNNEI